MPISDLPSPPSFSPSTALRRWYALGAGACFLLIGFALFSQFQWGLQPCPLCIFQRIAFAVLGVVFALGAAHNPQGVGRWIYASGALLPALGGSAIAARHVWLTHLPADQVPSCGPGLNFLIDAFPLWNVVKMVLTGSGECAKVDWTFLGLSMPAWSLVWFIGLTIVGLVGAWRQKPVKINRVF